MELNKSRPIYLPKASRRFGRDSRTVFVGLLQKMGFLRRFLAARDQFFPQRIIEQHFLQEILFALRRRNEIGICGQLQGEGCSLSFLTASIDSPAMMVNDEITGHQMN